jgi:acetylornithine deacetylase
VWYSPDDDAASVRREIEERILAAARLDGWLQKQPPHIEWLSHWPASVLDVRHPLVDATRRAHAAATGTDATVAGHVAVIDATWLNLAGIPTINYGPGDIRFAHALNERVAIDELIAATKTYALLAAEWCGVA